MLGPVCPGHAITTHWHKTWVNDNSFVPPLPLLYFHTHCGRASQGARWGGVVLSYSILYPAQQITICSATHKQLSHPWVWYLTDFLNLLPLFYFCMKLSIRHLFLSLGHTFSPDFEQGPCKNKQRRRYMKTGNSLISSYCSNKLQRKEQGEKKTQLLLYNYRPVTQLIATVLHVLWLSWAPVHPDSDGS